MSALITLATAPAVACSPARCQPGYLLPRHMGRVPANTKALAWSPSRDLQGGPDAATQSLRLVNLDGQRDDVPALTLEAFSGQLYWVHLDGELREGGRYRLEAPEDCAALSVEFEVGPAVERPTALGALEIERPARARAYVATASGSCAADVPAVSAEAKPELSAQASAWADLYIYETKVDDRPYHPDRHLLERPSPEAATTLFAECEGPYEPGEMRDRAAVRTGLSEGEHAATIEARLPGEEVVAKSSQSRVTLRCDTAAQEDDEDEDAPVDEAAPAARDSGCQLGFTAHTNNGGWTWCAVPLALLALRARRRSQRAHQE